MLRFEFNLLTFLLGIVSGVIGQWIWHNWIAKKPPEPIFAIFPDELGNINVTSKLGPNYPEFKVSSLQGTFAYTRPQTGTTDTGDGDI